jgi:hypothetical protein
LFSDENFAFFKDSGKNEIVKSGICIYMAKPTGNYKLPKMNFTMVYQISKNGQEKSKKESKLVHHNRMTNYNSGELYSNIESSDEIDHDFYAPLT